MSVDPFWADRALFRDRDEQLDSIAAAYEPPEGVGVAMLALYLCVDSDAMRAIYVVEKYVPAEHWVDAGESIRAEMRRLMPREADKDFERWHKKSRTAGPLMRSRVVWVDVTLG